MATPLPKKTYNVPVPPTKSMGTPPAPQQQQPKQMFKANSGFAPKPQAQQNPFYKPQQPTTPTNKPITTYAGVVGAINKAQPSAATDLTVQRMKPAPATATATKPATAQPQQKLQQEIKPLTNPYAPTPQNSLYNAIIKPYQADIAPMAMSDLQNRNAFFEQIQPQLQSEKERIANMYKSRLENTASTTNQLMQKAMQNKKAMAAQLGYSMPIDLTSDVANIGQMQDRIVEGVNNDLAGLETQYGNMGRNYAQQGLDYDPNNLANVFRSRQGLVSDAMQGIGQVLAPDVANANAQRNRYADAALNIQEGNNSYFMNNRNYLDNLKQQQFENMMTTKQFDSNQAQQKFNNEMAMREWNSLSPAEQQRLMYQIRASQASGGGRSSGGGNDWKRELELAKFELSQQKERNDQVNEFNDMLYKIQNDNPQAQEPKGLSIKDRLDIAEAHKKGLIDDATAQQYLGNTGSNSGRLGGLPTVQPAPSSAEGFGNWLSNLFN